jgi:hypothetical protein
MLIFQYPFECGWSIQRGVLPQSGVRHTPRFISVSSGDSVAIGAPNWPRKERLNSLEASVVPSGQVTVPVTGWQVRTVSLGFALSQNVPWNSSAYTAVHWPAAIEPNTSNQNLLLISLIQS